LDWTIQGTKDPAQCTAFGATTFNVALYNGAGGQGQWTQDCAAFATTISGLAADTYTGNANLLDATDAPRTTTVSLAPFAVIGGTTVTVAVDFPGRSFF
jgi:hypothetical protein